MPANTWPPTITTSTAEVASDSAVTTIRWGTDGLTPIVASPTEFFYVCTRFSQKELTEVIKLPQGSGLTMGRVYIKDGVHWSVTVRDDSSWTPPTVSSTVKVADGAGMIGAVGTVYDARVVDNDYETAVKQPGERVLVLERLTLCLP